MNDKEIRQFIKDNGIEVHDSGRFMQEIKRQISLLPDQPAIEDKDLLQIRTMLKAETRCYRRGAILTAVINLAYMLALALALFYLLPLSGSTNSAVVFIVRYNYLIFGISGILLTFTSLRSFIKIAE